MYTVWVIISRIVTTIVMIALIYICFCSYYGADAGFLGDYIEIGRAARGDFKVLIFAVILLLCIFPKLMGE